MSEKNCFFPIPTIFLCPMGHNQEWFFRQYPPFNVSNKGLFKWLAARIESSLNRNAPRLMSSHYGQFCGKSGRVWDKLYVQCACSVTQILFAMWDKYHWECETNIVCNVRQILFALRDKYCLQCETNTICSAREILCSSQNLHPGKNCGSGKTDMVAKNYHLEWNTTTLKSKNALTFSCLYHTIPYFCGLGRGVAVTISFKILALQKFAWSPPYPNPGTLVDKCNSQHFDNKSAYGKPWWKKR